MIPFFSLEYKRDAHYNQSNNHENLTTSFQKYVIYCMQKKPTQEKFLADIAFAKEVLLLESEAIKNLVDRLDHNFQNAVD